jgi:hypothetical protein
MATRIDGINYNFGSRIPANGEKSPQYLLVRLLLGAAEVEQGGRRMKQRQDYSNWPAATLLGAGGKAVSSYLRDQVGRTTSDFISATIIDNRRLFGDLLSEFASYFCACGSGAHTAAFVHLYRVLERVSFSLPLLYCATESDFEGTFNFLKKLFAEAGDGDLSLLKKFIAEGKLIDRTIVDTAVVIDFSASPLNSDRFYKAVSSRFKDADSLDPTRRQISVTFGNTQTLFIVVRNRFFHLRSGDGRNNISIAELHDSSEFFSLLNPIFCNFLAKLVLQIMIRKYGK